MLNPKVLEFMIYIKLLKKKKKKNSTWYKQKLQNKPNQTTHGINKTNQTAHGISQRGTVLKPFFQVVNLRNHTLLSCLPPNAAASPFSSLSFLICSNSLKIKTKLSKTQTISPYTFLPLAHTIKNGDNNPKLIPLLQSSPTLQTQLQNQTHHCSHLRPHVPSRNSTLHSRSRCHRRCRPRVPLCSL